MKKTYTDAINPMEYTSGLNKHLRIPQIDTKTLQEIINKTRDMLIDGIERVNIVDLWCGPGRLTNKIARLLVNDNVKITWIDEDKKFIDAAKKWAKWMDNIEYINSKLPNLCPKAHIFLTYGVWHHLDRKSERGEWRDMIIKNLADKWSFFIGDEYISSYTNEKSRIINATQLYTNVIWDAYQIAWKKVDELVRIEIMNRIEDLHESWIWKWVVSDYCLSEVANRCLNLKLELEDIWYKKWSLIC